MAQLPTIHLIHASDAPHHLGKLQEILQKLKAENRIAGFLTISHDAKLASLTDQVKDKDLVLTLLTQELGPCKEKIKSILRSSKSYHPEIKIAEIIVDHIPYENEFITFPADLKPIRSRYDMDTVWCEVEQNLKNMFPVQEPTPALKSVDWSKYLKVIGVAILLIGLIFSLFELINGDTDVVRERVTDPPIAIPDGNDGPQVEIEEVTDCYIETSLLTRAHVEPDPFSATQGTFPSNTKYSVIDIEVYEHGNLTEIYFFLIEDQERNLKGWVSSRSLEFFSTGCMGN